MTIKIELGKRYRRRDGKVTGPIQYQEWCFEDPHGENQLYTEGGFATDEMNFSPLDLVEEYVEPRKVETWAAINPNGDIKGIGVIKVILAEMYPKCKIIKLREVTDGK